MGGHFTWLSFIPSSNIIGFYETIFFPFSCITGTMTGGGRVLKGRMGSSIGTEISQEEVRAKYTHIMEALFIDGSKCKSRIKMVILFIFKGDLAIVQDIMIFCVFFPAGPHGKQAE